MVSLTPEVRYALSEMRDALVSIPRLPATTRKRVWGAFGHLRDALYRDGSASSDSPITTARAGG